jgi:hypothetical protein
MAFTASQLLKIQARADQMWADNRTRIDYIAEAEVVKALQAETTAQLDPLQDMNKTRTVKLIWLKTAAIAADAKTDDCDFTFPELSSDSTEYAIDLFQETGFSVKELATRTDEFSLADQIAKGTLACDKALSEYLAATSVAKLEAYRGTNNFLSHPGSVAWTFAAGDTTVPADQWTSGIMPKLSLTARMNHFLNPAIIAGRALWYEMEEAMNNQPNAEGKGDANRMNRYFNRKYFDPITVDEVNAGTMKAYLVDRGAFAFVTKNYFPDTPILVQNPYQQRYKVQSRNLPGVYWDVVYTQKCVSDEITHTFKFSVNAGIFQNPLAHDATNTGVLAFVRPDGI